MIGAIRTAAAIAAAIADAIRMAPERVDRDVGGTITPDGIKVTLTTGPFYPVLSAIVPIHESQSYAYPW